MFYINRDRFTTFNKHLIIHFVRDLMEMLVTQVNVSWKIMKIIMTADDLIFTH